MDLRKVRGDCRYDSPSVRDISNNKAEKDIKKGVNGCIDRLIFVESVFSKGWEIVRKGTEMKVSIILHWRVR